MNRQSFSSFRSRVRRSVSGKTVYWCLIILHANNTDSITQARVGYRGEPVAELTCLAGSSCTGIQTSSGTGFLAENSISNFEHLCALVVPALADTFACYQKKFHKELLEQLVRHREEGWYETGLPSNWYRPLLPTDKGGTLHRLHF